MCMYIVLYIILERIYYVCVVTWKMFMCVMESSFVIYELYLIEELWLYKKYLVFDIFEGVLF